MERCHWLIYIRTNILTVCSWSGEVCDHSRQLSPLGMVPSVPGGAWGIERPIKKLMLSSSLKNVGIFERDTDWLLGSWERSWSSLFECVGGLGSILWLLPSIIWSFRVKCSQKSGFTKRDCRSWKTGRDWSVWGPRRSLKWGEMRTSAGGGFNKMSK